MATTENSAAEALALDVDGDVAVTVESPADAGGSLVRVQSSSGRVSVCAYVDDTASRRDIDAVLRDVAAELQYQAGPADGEGGDGR